MRPPRALLVLLTLMPRAVEAGPPPRLWLAAAANNAGLSADPPLRYAESDARAVLSALGDVTPIAGPRVVHLPGATLLSLRGFFERARRELGPEDTLIFFLSSHGDRAGAHLGGSLLDWAVLQRWIGALPAGRVIAIVDACQSGALIGEKGFVRGPPIVVAASAVSPRGHLLITSSGANEVSHESILLAGSPFTHHLISGLRGAADGDHDGQVTVFELYQHTFERTVASTLESPLGPQRPRQRVDLAGAGDWVVGRTAEPGARLLGSRRRAERCWVLDDEEQRVVGEIGGAERIGLRPGRYVVKCPRPDHRLAVATLDLTTEAEIDQLGFAIREASFSLVKGPGGLHEVRAGAFGALLIRSAREVSPGLGLEVSGGSGELGWHLEALLEKQSEQGAAVFLAGAGYVLPWWEAGRLEIGLEVGGAITPLGAGFLFGQRLDLEVPLLGSASLSARAHALTEAIPRRASPLALVFALTLGVSVPLGSSSGIESASPLLGDRGKD
ncbi:MAG: caspase family protein [Deltaproteobacteria bacterium]|nr:caspase family protein [Deltaproteobacteria bacterium]